MRIKTTGEVFTAVCDVQAEWCRARTPAPVTAVLTPFPQARVSVCRPCLEDMVRNGEWEIPGARVAPEHDVAVLDRRGRPRLFIDAKRPPCCGDVGDWARRVHHNLIHFSGLPAGTAYLLIGFPDRYFGWTAAAARNPDSAPTCELRCAEVLAPFLADADGDGPAARESAVAAWMESVLAAVEPGSGGPAGWLADAGVLATVRGGFVARPLAAA
jgi:hypothetical protein